jgi:8-oxo-dGTP pyrophosphatase MutT (NUDIX family)
VSTTNILEVCVLVRKEDKLLFLLRSNTGYQDGTYCTPAGHVEPGESYRVAAARETMEEVGLRVDPKKLRHVLTTQRFTSPDDIRTGVYFEADEWFGEPKNMEPHKHSEIAWFPANDLPFNKLVGFQVRAFQCIADGLKYGEWGWQV